MQGLWKIAQDIWGFENDRYQSCQVSGRLCHPTNALERRRYEQ